MKRNVFAYFRVLSKVWLGETEQNTGKLKYDSILRNEIRTCNHYTALVNSDGTAASWGNMPCWQQINFSFSQTNVSVINYIPIGSSSINN